MVVFSFDLPKQKHGNCVSLMNQEARAKKKDRMPAVARYLELIQLAVELITIQQLKLEQLNHHKLS
ncbi:hypothetical protein ACS0TY_028070 [Phlomoides rotata]